MNAKASDILNKPYTYLLVKDEDGGYSARVVEFSGCFAEGDSMEEAGASLEAAAVAWVEAALEQGCDIPEPTGDNEYSGKFIVRIPRSLHHRCALLAEQEGVSLNQYVMSVLAQHAGEKRSESKFAEVAEQIKSQVGRVFEIVATFHQQGFFVWSEDEDESLYFGSTEPHKCYQFSGIRN